VPVSQEIVSLKDVISTDIFELLPGMINDNVLNKYDRPISTSI